MSADTTSIILDAIKAELKRQLNEQTNSLSWSEGLEWLDFEIVPGKAQVDGFIDLAALTQAIARAVENR
jgi:hypothetical protein